MFLLDYKSGTPIYEQLKHRTHELIAMGIISPGDKMPSVRSLARELGVNPNTIQKAYQDLERDGVIVSVGGKGSFVSESVLNNQRQIDESLVRLSKAAREARIFGAKLYECENVLKAVYAEEVNK